MRWNQWLETLPVSDQFAGISAELSTNRDERYVGNLIEESNRELSAICDLQQGLALCMSPSDGAELSGLAVYDNAQWNELLFRANDWTKIEGWPGRAPWLWPVAGRCYAASHTSHKDECSWEWKGVTREMPRHGFARHQVWHSNPPTVTPDNAQLLADLLADPSNKQFYPFDYHISTSYEFSDDGLGITFQVEASSENLEPMPFTLGQHFTFDFASWWGEDWLQGTVKNLGRHAWGTDDRAQATDRFELPSGSVGLLDPAFHSAIIPARLREPVHLVSPDCDRTLEMSFEEASANADDLLWVSFLDPHKRFFCLEPWVGWPNAINSGRGRVVLQPGEAWQLRLRLKLTTARCSLQEIPSATGQGSRPYA